MAQADPERPASVLDASALLAHLNEEDGASVVRQVLAAGAAISVVNWVEVLSKLAERGEDPELAMVKMKVSGLIGGVVSIEPLTDKDAVQAAQLRPLTRSHGLSLADRACLALALRLDAPVITADRAWTEIPSLGIDISLIRGL